MINVNTLASRTQIDVLDAPQRLYLLATVFPPEQETGQRIALNIALVIDRSTSMKGDRLSRVKAAANMIVDHLAPEDRLAVVTFSDRAEVVLPSSRIRSRAQLQSAIQDTTASGGTEILQGLLAGLNELKQTTLATHLNHLILLTDGHTYGDADECLLLAKTAAAQNIGISAFGIGTEWNDQFLDQLVAPSGGRSGYIESPEQIYQKLQARIKGLGATYANNLRLALNLPPGVTVEDAFKVAPYAQPLPAQMPLQLGAIEGVSPVAILLELTIAPQMAGTQLPLELVFTADIPGQEIMNVSQTDRANLLVLSDAPGDGLAEEPPEALIEAVRVLNLYRMHEQVWLEMDSGDTRAATQRMQRLATRMMEAGHTQLAEQVHRETQHLAAMGTMSLAGRKQIKYGTRRLFTQALAQTIALTDE